jgi:hypothetical protein
MTKLNLEPDKSPRIESEFRSKCPTCGEWIEEGNMIVKTMDDEWIHEDCDD